MPSSTEESLLVFVGGGRPWPGILVTDKGDMSREEFILIPTRFDSRKAFGSLGHNFDASFGLSSIIERFAASITQSI